MVPVDSLGPHDGRGGQPGVSLLGDHHPRAIERLTRFLDNNKAIVAW